jgi:hypothetical protein
MLPPFSMLKMEAAGFSEIVVSTSKTTQTTFLLVD